METTFQPAILASGAPLAPAPWLRGASGRSARLRAWGRRSSRPPSGRRTGGSIRPRPCSTASTACCCATFGRMRGWGTSTFPVTGASSAIPCSGRRSGSTAGVSATSWGCCRWRGRRRSFSGSCCWSTPGGPAARSGARGERGYLRLSDSNHDWGQGLPELAAWQRRRGNPLLAVWYFGKDPRIRTLPVRRKLLQHVRAGTAEDLAAIVGPSYLAVSTTYLYGAPGNPALERLVGFLRRQRPAARTTTFLIYDFRRPPESRTQASAAE